VSSLFGACYENRALQGGDDLRSVNSLFRTRREPVHGGSGAASMPRTVLKREFTLQRPLHLVFRSTRAWELTDRPLRDRGHMEGPAGKRDPERSSLAERKERVCIQLLKHAVNPSMGARSPVRRPRLPWRLRFQKQATHPLLPVCKKCAPGTRFANRAFHIATISHRPIRQLPCPSRAIFLMQRPLRGELSFQDRG
jgi:hypothetical protein